MVTVAGRKGPFLKHAGGSPWTARALQNFDPSKQYNKRQRPVRKFFARRQRCLLELQRSSPLPRSLF